MFRVGTAKVNINPPADCFPMPTSRGGSLMGVRENEDLHVRAIAIDNGERTIYIVCAELSGPANPYVIEKRLEKELGIPRENVLLTGTHSHAVPPTDVRTYQQHLRILQGSGDFKVNNSSARDIAKDSPNTKPTSPQTERFREIGINGTIEAIRQSALNMKPAKIGFGRGESYINVNRDHLNEDGTWAEGPNPAGFSDRELQVIRFDDYDGNLIAAVLNYGCHANTTYISKDIDGVRKVTCEFTGIACNYIENRFGNDSVVLWTSGAGGDQNVVSNFLVPDYEPDGTWKLAEAVPGATYQNMVSIGKTHAIDAIKIMKNIAQMDEHLDIKVSSGVNKLNTRQLPDGMTRQEYVVKMAEAERNGTPYIDMVPGEPKEMYNQLIMLNDIAIMGYACEMYSKIGYDVKHASPYEKTMIVTHCGVPMTGYIQDEESRYNVVFQHFSGVDPVGITEAFIKIERDRLRDVGIDI